MGGSGPIVTDTKPVQDVGLARPITPKVEPEQRPVPPKPVEVSELLPPPPRIKRNICKVAVAATPTSVRLC